MRGLGDVTAPGWSFVASYAAIVLPFPMSKIAPSHSQWYRSL